MINVCCCTRLPNYIVSALIASGLAAHDGLGRGFARKDLRRAAAEGAGALLDLQDLIGERL